MLILGSASLIVAIVAYNTSTTVKDFEYLLVKLDTSITKQDSILFEVRNQLSLQKEEMNVFNSQVIELQKQTKSLYALEESDRNTAKSLLIADFIKLHENIRELESYNQFVQVFLVGNIGEIEIVMQGRILELLRDYLEVLKSGISNDFLKKNEKVYAQWWVFENQLQGTIETLNDKSLYQKYYNFKKAEGNYLLNGKKISKREFILNTIKRFQLYSNTFIIKGIDPIKKQKKFEELKIKYFELSDFGRPIID